MFLLQWINNYISTSKMDMTVEIELLFYCALAIISVLVMVGMAGIYGMYYVVKKNV